MVKGRIAGAIEYLSKKRLTTVAGAWVFFFLTSVVPLAFLMVTAFGVFGVSITQDLVSRLPEEFRTAGELIASTAEQASRGTTIIFIGSVVLSCTTLLNQMSKDGDCLYGIKAKHKRGLFRRLWAFVALAVLFLLFLTVAFVFSFGGNILKSTLGTVRNKLVLTILTFFIVITFGYFIIIVLNKFISPVKVKFTEIWLGAFVSLFIIVLGTIGYMLYLRLFNAYNAFYGSLAAIVIFLLWAYIAMLGLVLGVILNTRIKNIKKAKKNL